MVRYLIIAKVKSVVISYRLFKKCHLYFKIKNEEVIVKNEEYRGHLEEEKNFISHHIIISSVFCIDVFTHSETSAKENIFYLEYLYFYSHYSPS